MLNVLLWWYYDIHTSLSDHLMLLKQFITPKMYFHVLCYFDMIQPCHFSLSSYSCLHFILWSNCDSKDMPLNFHDQIWPHIFFPASHFHPPPQPPTLLVLLLACPASSGAASALWGTAFTVLWLQHVFSAHALGAGETKCWDRLQGTQAAYCFTARPSKGEAKRRHKYVYVCLFQQV